MGEEDVGNSAAGEEIIELNLKGKRQVEYPAEGLHGGPKESDRACVGFRRWCKRQCSVRVWEQHRQGQV